MKKLLSNRIFLGALIVGLSGAVAVLALSLYRTPDRQQTYERILTSHHLRLSEFMPEGTVHFFGASTIQGLYVHDISSGAVNFGIGGETSAGLARRMPRYPSLRTAPAVVLQAGYNDRRGLAIEQTERNYAMIFDAVPENAQIYLITYQPTTGRNQDTVQASVLELNALLRDVCAVEARCQLVDLYEALSGSDRSGLDQDGVHLNAYGYEVLSTLLSAAMQEQ